MSLSLELDEMSSSVGEKKPTMDEIIPICG
jgi:hypothetical protein